MTPNSNAGFKPPLLRNVIRIFESFVWLLAMFSRDANCLKNTGGTQVPATLSRWVWQRLLGVNGGAYWPMHPSSTVSYAKRVWIGLETSPGWSAGCMIHGVNGIEIGDYTQISQNVALLSGNHDPTDLSLQLSAPPIRIGKYCLLGFNVVVMPGVTLGDYTIVGANSVVTKSFPEGYVVLAGVPAKQVRTLEKSIVRHYSSPLESRYHGYVAAVDFPEFARKHLSPL